MSYIPAIAFMWFGRDYSRVLFVPTHVALTLFANGQVLPSDASDASDESDELDASYALDELNKGKPSDRVKSLVELIGRFVDSNEADNDLFDAIYDDISKMPMCSEISCEFEHRRSVDFGDVPTGLAIAQWHVRSTDTRLQ